MWQSQSATIAQRPLPDSQENVAQNIFERSQIGTKKSKIRE
jgi:hypothetical protein